MRLLDRLFSWFGKTSATGLLEPDGAVATAVLHEHVAAAGASAQPPVLAWWVPQGEPLLLDPAPQALAQTPETDLHRRLTAVLDDPNLELPRLPQTAHRALLLLRDENLDYRRLARLVAHDPAVAAQFLRVANSAAYGGVRKAKNLEVAFSRLGHRKIRSTVIATGVKGLTLQVGGAERTRGEEIWRRSLASAAILGQMAGRFHLHAEEMFLIGLLHDLGMLAVLRVLHDYERQHAREIPRSLFDRLSLDWHEPLGQHLAHAWNLPDPLPELIGDHHRAVQRNDPLAQQRALIQFADAACSMIGYGPYVPYDFFNLPCVQFLGLTDEPATHQLLSRLPAAITDRLELF